MPLNYTSLEQVSGWRFLRHRLSVAVARHSVRLVHDPSRNATASLLVGAVISTLVVGVCFVIAFFDKKGQVGQAAIVADRASGALYVDVAGVMHPALNLASARLITGRADKPKMVTKAQIDKLPIGPMVGIAGAPNDLAVHNPGRAQWALCDHLGAVGSKVVPKVTVLAGATDLGDWAHTVDAPQAALMSYGGSVYLVRGGKRSQIDLADRAVTLALGLRAGGMPAAAPMSRALFEALMPTAPLRVPDIPEAGGPVGYASVMVPVVSGSVLRSTDAAGQQSFFVALPAGVQPIPATVAVMLSTADVSGKREVLQVDSTLVASLPQAVGFDVSVYPTSELTLIDKAIEPVTCVAWSKGFGEPQATIAAISGRRLPVGLDQERRVMTLVSGAAHGAADAVYLGSGAPNFIQVTGFEPDSGRSESLWWVGDSGVRFGIETFGEDDRTTRKSLGLDDVSPSPAPWSVVRWLPAGPSLSHAAAMTQYDTVFSDAPSTPLVGPS
ncbi:type VII secretion protein EccB [Mycobacterium sp. M1]|uniref:Type VII secretion protein EccB n=1 Tax=Mycolicibacter acidiphilus TaxID=2835306 RepID=A0ABS5RNU7_9MYCO|nr:type VII secretion protein EccB [Mycolicibacter acidiphilus]MBS9535982.1 type VII secretion protein EccB [Mycolicibacter acidiphilus]